MSGRTAVMTRENRSGPAGGGAQARPTMQPSESLGLPDLAPLPAGPGHDLSWVPASLASPGWPLPPPPPPRPGEVRGRLGTRVQAKVLVGAADDPFECEADAVAARVMRMPVDDRLVSASSAPRVQRACEQCWKVGEADTIRRHVVAPGLDPSEALSQVQLTQGGSALSPSVRSFFEPRFGRDFSEVRIHAGSESLERNAELSSHAFTYQNHIWLGQGETAQASLLLAHELAHVVQQTGSRTLQGQEQAPADREGRARRQVTDFWYFEPGNTTGTTTHALVLPELQQANPGLLHEVPSPVSSNDLAVYDKKGRADLYWPEPKSVVGIFYKEHEWPENLPGFRRRAGVRVAPVYDSFTETLKNMADAPTEILIGDLKPIGLPASKGVEQVQEYINGLELVLREAQNAGKIKVDGTWAAKKGYAKPLAGKTADKQQLRGMVVPDRYQPPTFSGQNAQALVLKSASLAGRALDRIVVKKVLPLEDVKGYLAVGEDPQFRGKGIWNHFWVPESLPDEALPEDLRRLDQATRRQIIPSLTRAPVRGQPKLRRDALTRDAAPVVRRRGAPKGISVKDPFVYPVWLRDVDTVAKVFQKTKQKEETQKSIEGLEATEAAVKNLHKVGAGTRLQVPKAAEGVSKLKFWTSPAAPVLGRFREILGGAVISIARLFLFGREKLRLLIKNHQKQAPGAPGGAMGAIVKIIFKVAKYALVAVLPTVVDRLWRSLVDGVTKKLSELIPDSIAEKYDALKPELDKAMPFLEKLAAMDAVQWLRDLVAPVEDILSKIGKAVSVLRQVKNIVSSIKWAIRTINCVAVIKGNVVGCIGSFIRPLADWLIEKIVERCSVQRTIIRELLRIDLVTTTAPNWIAGQLIDFARKLLPAGYENILADVPQSSYMTDTVDVPCKEERTSTEIVMDELSLLLGGDEAKIFALTELMSAMGGDDLKMDSKKADKILEMGGLIQALGITAEQMQNWARTIGEVPKDMPDAFRQSLDEFFRSIATGDKAPEKVDVPQPAADQGQGTGGGGAGQGGGAGEGKGPGAGGTGDEALPGEKQVTTVPGSTMRFDGLATGRPKDATVEIVAGASRDHKRRGQKATLSLYGVRESAGIDLVVSGVPATVDSATTKGSKVVSVTYVIEEAVTFDLKRAEEARRKGEALACYRLCILKGRKWTKKF